MKLVKKKPKPKKQSKVDKLIDQLNTDPGRRLKGNWTMNTEQDIECLFGLDISKELISSLEENITKQIDETIMSSIQISLTATKLR